MKRTRKKPPSRIFRGSLFVDLNLEFNGRAAQSLLVHAEKRSTTPKVIVADLVWAILQDDLVDAVLDDGVAV